MIDLYYWTTPNGHKITIFLEEAAIAYRIVPVNISKGEQFKPAFLAISPNNRMPAIVDYDPKDGGKPISVFESGAILLYLGEKTGNYLPAGWAPRPRRGDGVAVLANGGLGPMAGQNHHFSQYVPEKIPYAVERYVKGRIVSMACSTSGFRIVNSLPGATRLPTWPFIRGSSLTSAKARSLRTSHTSSAGSMRCASGRR